MSAEDPNDEYLDCSFVSIHYIICECGETFPSESGLKAHLEKEHPHKRERKEFKCGVCGIIFLSEDDCISHYEEAHIATDIKTELEDPEDVVPETEEPVPETEESVPETESVPQPEYPDTEYPEIEERVEFQEQEEEVDVKPNIETLQAEAQLLEISADSTEEGTQLMQLQDENGTQLQLVQITSDGTIILLEPASMKVPFLSMVKTKPRPRPTKPAKTIPKYIICEVCGKSYASAAALKYHQRVHTGERPYSCTFCPRKFAMPLFLQIHVRTHTGERPYQCPECPKAFSNKAALLRHDRVHTGEKPYECPMCQKFFTQSNSMKLHVATVHLKQPAPYKSKARRLKAQERKMQAKLSKNPEITVRSYNKKDSLNSENVVKMEIQLETENVKNVQLENLEEQNIAVRSLAELDDNVYEVIESEVVNDGSEREVYEIIYDDSH